MQLNKLAEEIEINGVKITPIVELLKSQLVKIYGKNFESDFEVKEILTDHQDEKFGVVATYFDDRIGFSFNNQDHWREFELTCGNGNQSEMMINQLEMFDQIREWGFLI
jgi:hypothetical protein